MLVPNDRQRLELASGSVALQPACHDDTGLVVDPAAARRSG